MAFEPDYLSAMASSVTIIPTTARDGYGAPIEDTSVQVPGHITYQTKALRKNAEDTVISTARVQIPPPAYAVDSVTTPTVHEEDEVTLPDGVTRHVLMAVLYTDDTGPHHQTLWLT